MIKATATRLGEKLLRKMTGKGWKLHEMGGNMTLRGCAMALESRDIEEGVFNIHERRDQ